MDSRNKKKIWIDLDNSPHVLFFKPVIDELKKQNFTVVITARDCFQVIGLADMYKLEYRKIGTHFGKNKFLKVLGLIVRALQLLPFALRERPALALSHGSRAQAVVANLLFMDSIIAYDYEFAKSLFITRPKWYMAPELLQNDPFKRKNVLQYPGIKEDVYVPFFKPDGSLRSELGITDDEILISIRPPANEAHYHNPESEPIFEGIIDTFAKNELVRMIVLPRGNGQKEMIKEKWADLIKSRKLIIPEKVYDGLNLIWASDLVISGGGTMNREAAALNVPVYSIFRGKLGAVDRFLSEQGRLVLIESVQDINKIAVIKRVPETCNRRSTDTIDMVVKHIVNIVDPDENDVTEAVTAAN